MADDQENGVAPGLQSSDDGGEHMANEECAHCGTLITEWSTVAKREGKVFCCPNCANAYARAQEAPNEVPRGV